MKTAKTLLLTLLVGIFTFSSEAQNLALDVGWSGRVNVPDHNDLDLNYPLTIEAWFNQGANNGSWKILLDKRLSNDAICNYGIGLFNGRPAFFFRSSSWKTHVSSTFVNPGTWNHMAWVYDGSTMVCYLNGAQIYSVPESQNLATTSQGLTFGDRQQGGQGYIGKMDEIRIWKKARTQAEIQADMNCELTGSNCDLVAYYKFNNSSATPGGNNAGVTSVTDNSGNGHNGTVANIALSGSTDNWVTGSPGVSGNCTASPCPPAVWMGTTSTDWNTASNWSPAGVPTSTDNVNIDGNASNQPAIGLLQVNQVGNITFTNNPTINLASSGILNIGGDVTGSATISGTGTTDFSGGNHTFNDPVSFTGIVVVKTGVNVISNGNVTLEDGASLMHGIGTPGAGGTVTGNINVKRDGHAGSQYNHWGAPTSGIAAGQFGGTVYRYDEQNNDPTDFRLDYLTFSGTLQQGIGYTNKGGGTQTFTGIAGDGNYNSTAYNTASSNIIEDGWNLVANPYPCSVEQADFTTTNTGIDGTIYFWADPNLAETAYQTTHYATRNASGTTTTGGGSVAPNGQIPSCQGIFVHKTGVGSTTVQWTNSMRTSLNDQFFRTGDDEIQRIKLNITDANGAYDEALIAFAPEATDGWDRMYDGLKIPGNGLNVYTKLDDKNYVIQAWAPVETNKAIPVELTTASNGEMTLDFSTENFATETGLWLEDRERGVWVDLRKEEPYTFFMAEEAAVIRNRFFVHVNVETVDQPQTSTGISSEESNIEVFSFNNTIVVRSIQVMNGELQVLNMLGQVIYTETVSGTQSNIQLDLADGNYVVRYLEEGLSYTSKIHISK